MENSICLSHFRCSLRKCQEHLCFRVLYKISLLSESMRRSRKQKTISPHTNRIRHVEVKVRNLRILPRKCDISLSGPIEKQLHYYIRKISSSPRIAAKKIMKKEFLMVTANKIVVRKQVKFSNVFKGRFTIRDIRKDGDHNANVIVKRDEGKDTPHSRSSRKSHDCYRLGRDISMKKDTSEAPSSVVPKWAEERILSRTLRRSQRVPSEVLFAQPDPPNLDLMFPGTSRQRNIWNSPSK